MSNHDRDSHEDDDPWADVKDRFHDIYRPTVRTRWAAIKDRLALIAVVLALAFLVFMMIDGSIENLRCSFVQFITFECNRWDAAPKPWN
jgi:hypothetical protein